VNAREKVTGIDEYRLIFKLKLVCHTYKANGHLSFTEKKGFSLARIMRQKRPASFQNLQS